ncbi:MAG TPA: ParB/RepB/Spo0J family partition protein [Clostridia bacterium]|nr:ParB/RepB/Spo0J family partition protein [Clostridia bacterium]
MAKKIGGLGRGLDALFADNAVEDGGSSGAVKLKLMDIEPNRDQPRKNFDEEALSELAQSIADHGIIQPILVRPLADGGYQLVAGERRWRAARLAGLTEVPVVIRELTEDEVIVLSLIENLQREDLNPIEEALGFQKLMETFNVSQEQAAEKAGKSRPAIANSLRLLKLPAQVIEYVAEGKISAGHGRSLLAFEQEEDIFETADLIIRKGISVREVERLAKAASRKKTKTSTDKTRREPYFDEVELALTDALARKVKVTTQSGKASGTLEIDFNDQEDLTALARALHAFED